MFMPVRLDTRAAVSGNDGVWPENWMCFKLLNIGHVANGSPRQCYFRDQYENPRPIPVPHNHARWLDEPAAVASDRLPQRREPSFARTTRKSEAPSQRRSAAPIGVQSKGTWTQAADRDGHDRYARDAF